ncbi:conserved hypothetical protein [Vibrio chagasii]|nr:conserved hypothetical protein [Vibrio chagasii]CAH7437667.1 conserved hypothetical protein [Vibrio chagasii]
MSLQYYNIKLSKNAKGTLFSKIKGKNGLITAYISKINLTENRFYAPPIMGREYIALVKRVPQGSHFIQQLIPVEFSDFKQPTMVRVSYRGDISPQISCSDKHGKELLSIVSESDENYRKLRYRVSHNSLIGISFLRGEKGFKLEVVEDKAKPTQLKGYLYNITLKPTNTSFKLYRAWFCSDDGQRLYTEFPCYLIDDFLVVTDSCELHNVTLDFDHKKHRSNVCLKQAKDKLAQKLEAQKVGHHFYFLNSDGEKYHFTFKALGMTFRTTAWKNELQRFGIECDKLTANDLVEGLLKVTFKKEKGQLYLGIVFSNCTNYEGLITYQRSFIKNKVKHLVFKTQPFNGNQFIIKQPELFAHSIIDYTEKGVVERASVYEFKKNEKAAREWKIKSRGPIGKALKQGELVVFDGKAAHDWYVYSQEKDSPFGKVYRELDSYALRNHLVCQVISQGVAHMVFIPAPLLKLQGITQIVTGTRIRGTARLELLELFTERQQGLLADTCKVIDDSELATGLPVQSSVSIEELTFTCEETSQAFRHYDKKANAYKTVHVYRLESLDTKRTFKFKDYSDQLLTISEPECYQYVCKIQVNGQFNNVKEILSAKFRQ